MNNPTCAQCDCVAGCQSHERLCPNVAGITIGMRDGIYLDSTPKLHVGGSSFEDWFQAQEKACTGDKQLARDAYAAGMGDPLVTYAPPKGTK